MAESQEHGFVFEELIAKAYPGHIPDRSRKEWDILARYNPNNLNISIKSIREGGSIDMGSLVRFYKKTEPFEMIILTHRQEQEYKKIISIDTYIIDIPLLSKLKGSLTLDQVLEWERKIQYPSKGGLFDEKEYKEARAWYKETINKNEHLFGACKPTCKIDSKGQRRWQCTINRLFFDNIHELSYSNILHNIALPYKILSSARKRNKKEKNEI